MPLSLHPVAIAWPGVSALQLRWLLEADGIPLGFPFLRNSGEKSSLHVFLVFFQASAFVRPLLHLRSKLLLVAVA